MSVGPIPEPTPETAPFWQGAAAGELRIQRCASCESFYFYPRPFCPKCNSDAVEWRPVSRSEEHTSELQLLMRISYAVFCLKKKNHTPHTTTPKTRKNKN